MSGLSINILLIIVIIAAIGKACDGYKKGMVKEIISLVSMLILCGVIALIAGVSSYHDGKMVHVVVTVVLLGLLGIVHHLLSLVFFSAKLVSSFRW